MLAWIRLLPNCPEPPKSGSVHGWLIDHLGDPDPLCDVSIAERSRKLGRLMLAQRGRRVRADYELENPVNQTMLSKQIESARKTFETCADPES
ncbi:MAG: hypothetical protein EOP37_27005 [Rubrivivax sp.]|nr:MAG: hypothetical protein EOP37_27005 [Rubrivivax sp.]